MASFGQKENIHWCGTKSTRLERKGISPCGTVAPVPLGNGKAQTRLLGNVYAQIVQAEKLLRGWVWYEACDECPPVGSGGNRSHEEIASLGLCEKCTVRETLIATRQSVQTSDASEYANQFESRIEKVAKMMEAQMVGNVRPQLTDDQLAAAMGVPIKKAKSASKSR